VRAYHRGGIFQRPQFEDVSAEIKSWEARNQADLNKLAALIEKIITVVRGFGKPILLKYDPLGDKLVFCETEGADMLPEDLYSKWDKVQAEAEVDTKPDAKTDTFQGDEGSNGGKQSRP
jgi:hypothetical protein